MDMFVHTNNRKETRDVKVLGVKLQSSASFSVPFVGGWVTQLPDVLEAFPGQLFRQSTRRAFRELQESSQRVPRELPESFFRRAISWSVFMLWNTGKVGFSEQFIYKCVASAGN